MQETAAYWLVIGAILAFTAGAGIGLGVWCVAWAQATSRAYRRWRVAQAGWMRRFVGLVLLALLVVATGLWGMSALMLFFLIVIQHWRVAGEWLVLVVVLAVIRVAIARLFSWFMRGPEATPWQRLLRGVE